MAKTQESRAAPAGSGSRRARVLREWVFPIVLGLAIGGGVVWAWPYVLHSPARRIVDRWRPDDYELNDELAAELRALGSSARADVFDAFLHVDGRELPELKAWVGERLAQEPFFDTASLLELVRDANADAWSRRVAAAVLVKLARREVDPGLVLPLLLDWLEDLSVPSHTVALRAVEQLARDGMIPPDLEARARDAVLRLTERAARADLPEEWAEFVLEDREMAVYTLGAFLPDEEARKGMWAVALDEDDDDGVRIMAVRGLAERNVFDDVEPWRRVSRSRSVVVRQTAADNLFRAKDPAYGPAYDEVLAPMHRDAGNLVRMGSIDSQVKRRSPTMLEDRAFEELLEDHDEWVRFEAMYAAGLFKDVKDGLARREGILLRVLAESDGAVDVMGAILALHMITGECFGFRKADLQVQQQAVDEGALKAFLKDPEGRADAVRRWREALGPEAVWTGEDRERTLARLSEHADPANVARAKEELAKLRGK